MTNYQMIAKKFRPQNFSHVVGQEVVIKTLKNAIGLNRLAHAYLFCGIRGTGKTTLARILAKAINCESLTEEREPCNACTSCKEIQSGHSLDVIEIDGASNRGIDDIRLLNETVGYAPSSGKYKVYIIDEVHMLTKEAFNALLKTLEEPPSHVKFFFATTEPHKVLPTIISRCQRYDLNRISPESISKKLLTIAKELDISVESEALDLIADRCEGSLRDAESLLDQTLCLHASPITRSHVAETLGLVPENLFKTLDEAYMAGDLSAAFSLADTIFQSGYHLIYFLENLTEHFRTILHKTLCGQGQNLPYSKESALDIFEYLVKWLGEIHQMPFKRVHLEMILLHILRSSKQIPLDALVRELKELKDQVQEAPAKATIPVEPTPKKVKTPRDEPPIKAPVTKDERIHHDTLMQFAGVELNGSVKKGT